MSSPTWRAPAQPDAFRMAHNFSPGTIAFVTMVPARVENRAMQGCNPSADPGTKTEAGCPARHPVSLGPREPRDWYQAINPGGLGAGPQKSRFCTTPALSACRQIRQRILDIANGSVRASSPPPIGLASIRTLGEPLRARCFLGSVQTGCCYL